MSPAARSSRNAARRPKSFADIYRPVDNLLKIARELMVICPRFDNDPWRNATPPDRVYIGECSALAKYVENVHREMPEDSNVFAVRDMLGAVAHAEPHLRLSIINLNHKEWSSDKRIMVNGQKLRSPLWVILSRLASNLYWDFHDEQRKGEHKYARMVRQWERRRLTLVSTEKNSNIVNKFLQERRAQQEERESQVQGMITWTSLAARKLGPVET